MASETGILASESSNSMWSAGNQNLRLPGEVSEDPVQKTHESLHALSKGLLDEDWSLVEEINKDLSFHSDSTSKLTSTASDCFTLDPNQMQQLLYQRPNTSFLEKCPQRFSSVLDTSLPLEDANLINDLCNPQSRSMLAPLGPINGVLDTGLINNMVTTTAPMLGGGWSKNFELGSSFQTFSSGAQIMNLSSIQHVPAMGDGFVSPNMLRNPRGMRHTGIGAGFCSNTNSTSNFVADQMEPKCRGGGFSGPSSPLKRSPSQCFASPSGDSSLDLGEEDCMRKNRGKRAFSSGSEDVAAAAELSIVDHGLVFKDEDDLDENGDVSGLLCENDDMGCGGNNSGGDQGRGKARKGLPAKNLMAERRRRKKLNDRLYMLRSVVPKITKMDRASILGDAIEYLKELLQRINDLHNELESGSLPDSPSAAPNVVPVQQIKDECAPDPEPPRIEVRMREGKSLNIHMFCARRPGLLLSTMRALDGLGLDVQQAVISCFNGFALDVFRAEQMKEGEIAEEGIKAVLLQAAGCPMSSMQNRTGLA